MKVIKRDGTIQEFDAAKLNKWAEWASEQCNVSWSDVVLDACQHFHDMMETDKIQSLLIEECLNRRDESHTKMAARLMLGKIYKEAHNSDIMPDLKDFYKEAVKHKWYQDLGYADEELDFLQQHIKHEKNLGYSYASLKQMYDKYFVNVGRRVESPQFLFMGLAMALMQHETENKLQKVIKEYEVLSDLKQSLPTPTLNGLRTPLMGSPSCVVISAKDHTESIGQANHLAYRYTAQRSGIGIEFDTRAPGEPVKNGRTTHGGKNSIYRNLQAQVNTLTQVTRGGSATVTYNCLDPEVLDLLTMKQQRTQESYKIDHLDYSLAVKDLFLSKVQKNEDWMLVSSFYAPKLHELFYSKDKNAFEEEYNRVLNQGGKHIKIVKARDIALKFVEARSDTGRNYLVFIDNQNQYTPFKEGIRLSNLCLTGDTEVETNRGITTLKDLAEIQTNLGKEELNKILIKSFDVETQKTVFMPLEAAFLTEKNNTDLYKIEYEGKIIRCTGDHEILTKERGWVKAKDLIETDELIVDLENAVGKFDDIKSVKITKINDVEDVYDLTVQETHNFYANGIVVHNCQEIFLPTKGYNSVFELDKELHPESSGETALCFLQAHIVDDYTDQEWEDLAYSTALSVDNTIEYSQYPFKQIEFTAKKRRSIGIGLTGLASHLARKELKYSSPEALKEIHKIQEKHSFYLHKASVRLAKERGKCEYYDRTRYSDGWLPIDDKNDFLESQLPQGTSLECDWESLRKEIQQYGVRFSTLTAHMPCESSQSLNNQSNGLYPIRRKDVIKQSRTGTVYWIVPNSETHLQYYESAWDISDKDLATVYGVVQKFTSQGISQDFYHDYTTKGNVSQNDMLKLMLYSAKIGMKSWYYLNFKITKEFQELESLGDCESCKL